MDEKVEIFDIDEEGILIRAHMPEENILFEGDMEDLESPLMVALGIFYHSKAPSTLVAKGFETPTGPLYWHSELATPFGEDGDVEVGERLFLMDRHHERFMDFYAYQTLSEGKLPAGWAEILNN